MEMKAVLTADMVLSRRIAPATLEAAVVPIARELEAKLFRKKKTFEFYRGDSFQAIVPAEQALRIALLWKAGVQAVTAEDMSWDIRVAIGIGEIAHIGQNIASSGGTAFEYSGLLLDELKKKDYPRIGIRTPDEAWNQQLETECILADSIMQRWTAAGAETVFHMLLHEETQEQLATRMGIAQSSVHKRLNVANWAAIRHWQQYFQQQVLSFDKTKPA